MNEENEKPVFDVEQMDWYLENLEKHPLRAVTPKTVRARGMKHVEMPERGTEYTPLDLKVAWDEGELKFGDQVIFRNRIQGSDSYEHMLVRVVAFDEDRLIPPTPNAGCVSGCILWDPENKVLTMAFPEILGELADDLRDLLGCEKDVELHVYWFRLEEGGEANTMVKL